MGAKTMSRLDTRPSTEGREPAESERVTALLRQLEDVRHSNRRLVHANAELDLQMRTHAEQILAETARYEAARNQLQAQVNYFRAQSEHYQAEAKALWVENYELRVRLSALRYRAADRAARLVKRVPGLEWAARLTCRVLAAAARFALDPVVKGRGGRREEVSPSPPTPLPQSGGEGGRGAGLFLEVRAGGGEVTLSIPPQLSPSRAAHGAP
jgi:regulator of replication initiation timing